MNKKIMLALLPPWETIFVPLGIPCISTNLIQAGYNVIQKDFNLEIYPDVISKNKNILFNYAIMSYEDQYEKNALPLLINYLNKWADEIIKTNVSIAGFTTFTLNKYSIYYISRILKEKKPDLKIIIGGPETIDDNSIIENDFIDYVITGEGEKTLLELVETINKSETDFKKIKGLSYRDEKNKVIYTGNNTIKNLDTIPYPTFKDFNINNYSINTMPVEGSRGCINRCTFCGDRTLNRYRFKTGKRLYDELYFFYKNYNQTYFGFVDSLINGNIKELESFCDYLINSEVNKEKQSIIWESNACIRKEMTFGLLKKMKIAGCNALNYGVESGSDYVLKTMNKNITALLTSEILSNTKRAGIKVRIFMIIGFPTETEKHFNETLNFIKYNKDNIDHIYAGGGFYINGTSDIAKNPENYGIYWNDEDEYQEWRTIYSDKNIRNNRVKIFVNHCKSLNLNVEYYTF